MSKKIINITLDNEIDKVLEENKTNKSKLINHLISDFF